MKPEELDALIARCEELEEENERLVVALEESRAAEEKARLSACTPATLVTLSEYGVKQGLQKSAMYERRTTWEGRGFPKPVWEGSITLYSEVDLQLFDESRARAREEKRKEVDALPWWTCRQKRDYRRRP
jgi:hypothetical protein